MIRCSTLLLALLFSGILSAQKKYDFRILLADKKFSAYSVNKPSEFLSQASIDRRNIQGFGIDESDLPVSEAYLDSLKALGVSIRYRSRWLNSVTVETTDSLFLDKIKEKPYVVQSGRVFRRIGMKTLNEISVVSQTEYTPGDYGLSYRQIQLNNGDQLHNAGFTGKGMKIAVIDAGFFRVDSLKAFDALRKRGGILGMHDFVLGKDSVFTQERHGMYVLSTIAGQLPGLLIGTAPDADFFLLKSENNDSEYPVEEDAWVSALEWADSAGAWVVNSSLGYTTFQNESMNHTYGQLNGSELPISRAAGMAARKGMIVVNSAGNSGATRWHYISAPADAKDILTVGAVDKDGNIAKFSSRGPSADGRVKPDVDAMGVFTYVASTLDGQVITNGGTSLAAPIITGLTACLWQAFPKMPSLKIMDAIRRSSSYYSEPNDSFGYGIADYSFAKELLEMDTSHTADFLLDVYPNPFYSQFTVGYYSRISQPVSVTVFDATGKVILDEHRVSEALNLNRFIIHTPGVLPQGVYIICIKTPDKIYYRKIIRD